MSSNFKLVRFAAIASLICLLSTLSIPASGAPPSTLDDLLTQANLASGAPFKHHVRSHGVDGAGRSVFLDEEGVASVRRRCNRALCFGLYLDGARLYNTNFNDTPLPVSGSAPMERTYQTIVSYAFTDPSFRRGGGRLAERDPLTAGGRIFRRITVLPRGGSAMDVSIDEATSLIASASSIDGTYRFVFGDQRPISGGLTVPFAIDLNGKPFDRFDAREESADRLEPPAGLLPQFAGASGGADMLKKDRPIVACTIGGITVPCLLDTGNSGMAMSLELAEALRLEPMETAAEVRGVGSYLTGVTKAPPITIAGCTLPSALYTILHDIHGYGYDVVLGADAFAHARVTIDYPKKRVTVAPSTDVADPHPLAVAFESFIPIVDMELADVDVRLMIDTGDDSGINLADDYYAQHRTLFKPTGKSRIGGAGGTAEQITGEIPSVRIAGFTLEHQKIGAQKQTARIADGHLGNGFLAHFAVVFDYARARVAFEPRSGDASIKTELSH